MKDEEPVLLVPRDNMVGTSSSSESDDPKITGAPRGNIFLEQDLSSGCFVATSDTAFGGEEVSGIPLRAFCLRRARSSRAEAEGCLLMLSFDL